MLTEELQNAAHALGEALHDSESVETYLKAQADCKADFQASVLEKRMFAVYDELIRRQEQGEVLSRSEIDAFNTLKRQVYQHPSIAERDAALRLVKSYFAEISDEINFPLGVEFPTLVRV